jgi:hypothetical protein
MGASVTLVALHEAADFSSPTLPDTDFATMLSFRRDNTGRLPRPVAAIERRWHNAQDGTKVGLLDPQDDATFLATRCRAARRRPGLL